jgi:hypothetical protein
VEPFAARRIAQGNGERIAAAAKADARIKRSRAETNRLDRELRETHEELSRAEAEFSAECGERRHPKPAPGWLFFAFVAVGVAGEWAVAYALLDFLAVRGNPNPDASFASYFADAGLLAGLSAALGDYANEKAALSLLVGSSVFVVAKVTGTWVRQTGARRAGSIPAWAVAAANVAFLLMCGAFAYLREAQLAREGMGELTGLWPVFLAVQAFTYVAAAFFSAWTSDPDPEAVRLAGRIDSLRESRARTWARRVAITERNAQAWAEAQDRAAQEIHDAVRSIAAYRDQNFANRPKGDPPPPFMLAAVGEEMFAPLPLDPPADPPAGDVRNAVGRLGTV